MASWSWRTGRRIPSSPLLTRAPRSFGRPCSRNPRSPSSLSGQWKARVGSRTSPSCPSATYRRCSPSCRRYLEKFLRFCAFINTRFRHRRRAPKRGHMALIACFSYPDRGDVRVVYGVIAAFRRIPRGVVSRGQVRTRLRLPLSPAAFLDRLEKGIKTKDILLQHSPSSMGPKICLWLSVPRPPFASSAPVLRFGCTGLAAVRWRFACV